MKLVAVDGFSYIIDDITISATITLTGVPSLKSSCEGKGVCKDGFGISLVTITDTETFANSGPILGSFDATAEKGEADGTKVLRVDDEASFSNILLTHPTSGATKTVSFKVKITDAGQNKVLCS